MFDIKFISIKAVQTVSMSEKQYNSIQSIINWKKKYHPCLSHLTASQAPCFGFCGEFPFNKRLTVVNHCCPDRRYSCHSRPRPRLQAYSTILGMVSLPYLEISTPMGIVILSSNMSFDN